MGVLWLIVIAVVMVLIQGIIYRFRALKRLDYYRAFTAETAYVGDHISMIEILTNRKLLPLPYVRVETRMSEALKFTGQEGLTIRGDLYHRSIFFLWSFKRIKRTHNVECVARGFYELKTVVISAGGLLDSVNMTKTYPVNTSMLIYPRILDEDELPIPAKKLIGDVIVKRWIMPDPFLVNGIRPFRNGDSLKDVHWRASAKGEELKVKTKDYTASPKIFIILNIEGSEDQWGNTKPENIDAIEYGISLCATLSTWAIKNGLEVGLATNGYIYGDETMSPVFYEPTGGEGGLLALYDMMARLVCGRSRTFYSFLEDIINTNLTGMDIIILSTYISPRITSQIERLKAAENSITIQSLTKEDHYAS